MHTIVYVDKDKRCQKCDSQAKLTTHFIERCVHSCYLNGYRSTSQTSGASICRKCTLLYQVKMVGISFLWFGFFTLFGIYFHIGSIIGSVNYSESFRTAMAWSYFALMMIVLILAARRIYFAGSFVLMGPNPRRATCNFCGKDCLAWVRPVCRPRRNIDVVPIR